MICGKNIISLLLNVLLALVLIHYYFAYVVIYNSRSKFTPVCNMLLYINFFFANVCYVLNICILLCAGVK